MPPKTSKLTKNQRRAGRRHYQSRLWQEAEMIEASHYENLNSSLAEPNLRPKKFLTLPPEIRNTIYALVLSADEKISLWGFSKIGGLGFTKVDLSLLRVNRQILREAAPVLYSLHTFTLSNSPSPKSYVGIQAFNKFIRRTPAASIQSIRSLDIPVFLIEDWNAFMYRKSRQRVWIKNTEEPKTLETQFLHFIERISRLLKGLQIVEFRLPRMNKEHEKVYSEAMISVLNKFLDMEKINSIQLRGEEPSEWESVVDEVKISHSSSKDKIRLLPPREPRVSFTDDSNAGWEIATDTPFSIGPGDAQPVESDSVPKPM